MSIQDTVAASHDAIAMHKAHMQNEIERLCSLPYTPKRVISPEIADTDIAATVQEIAFLLGQLTASQAVSSSGLWAFDFSKRTQLIAALAAETDILASQQNRNRAKSSSRG